MIDQSFNDLSLREQFFLLNLNRSSYYYQAIEPSDIDQNIANKISELWLIPNPTFKSNYDKIFLR